MGRRLWENMVTVLTYFHILTKISVALFLPSLCGTDKVVFLPSGRFWRRMNLAPSKPLLKRFFSNPKGKGEYVYIYKETIHMYWFHISNVLLSGFYFNLSGSTNDSDNECSVFCFSKFRRVIESYGQVRLGMVSQMFFFAAFYRHMYIFSWSPTMTLVDTTEQLLLILSRCATSMWWLTVLGVWRTRIWNQTD